MHAIWPVVVLLTVAQAPQPPTFKSGVNVVEVDVIRVAAVGGDKSHGSVFTELTIPKFDGDLALGGLGLAMLLPGGSASVDQRANTIPLTPLATRDIRQSAPVVAELPIRVSPKAASGSLVVTATLTRSDGTTTQIDSASQAASSFAGKAGNIYKVQLPTLAAGAYRLVIEATAGRANTRREMAFRILP